MKFLGKMGEIHNKKNEIKSLPPVMQQGSPIPESPPPPRCPRGISGPGILLLRPGELVFFENLKPTTQGERNFTA